MADELDEVEQDKKSKGGKKAKNAKKAKKSRSPSPVPEEDKKFVYVGAPKKLNTDEVKLRLIKTFTWSDKQEITDYPVDYVALGCKLWSTYLPERFPVCMEATRFPGDLINVIFDYAYGMVRHPLLHECRCEFHCINRRRPPPKRKNVPFLFSLKHVLVPMIGFFLVYCIARMNVK